MKNYVEPTVDLLILDNEDILTTSDPSKSDIFGDGSSDVD